MAAEPYDPARLYPSFVYVTGCAGAAVAFESASPMEKMYPLVAENAVVPFSKDALAVADPWVITLPDVL